MSSDDRNFAIGVTIAAVVILIASFLPWGTIRGDLTIPGLPAPGNGPLVPKMGVFVELTAWNSNATLGKLSLPNWLVAIAAAGVAILVWLKVTAVWASPAVLTFGLAGYGLLQSGSFVGVLLQSNNATAGVGGLLTVVGFVGLVAALIRHVLAAKSKAMLDLT